MYQVKRMTKRGRCCLKIYNRLEGVSNLLKEFVGDAVRCLERGRHIR